MEKAKLNCRVRELRIFHCLVPAIVVVMVIVVVFVVIFVVVFVVDVVSIIFIVVHVYLFMCFVVVVHFLNSYSLSPFLLCHFFSLHFAPHFRCRAA